MEILIIIILQVINGVFSMSEAALIAARKPRLQRAAEGGDRGAEAALKLAKDPNRFFSTVQVFITLIGILGGAFGGATIAGEIGRALADTPLAPYGEAVGLLIVVLFTTYVSLIIGELVPKRLALRSPERIASTVSRPMAFLSKVATPVVALLSTSTNGVLRLLGASRMDEPVVTEDEIKVMIQEGVQAGVFEASEHSMVENIFRLGDRRISSLMIPRLDVIYLDLQDSLEENQQKLIAHPYSRYPVCDGGLDHVIGLVQTKDIVIQLIAGGALNLRTCVTAPIFVPDSVMASRVLELFRESSLHAAFVIDEYGALQGLVTIQDLLEAIVGDDETDDPVQRADGSWLLDGMTPIEELKELLDVPAFEGEGEDFNTLGGFIMTQQGRIPHTGEYFVWRGYRFEIIDMDGRRVDKVLVTIVADEPPPTNR